MDLNRQNYIQTAIRILQTIEDTILVALLLLMIFLAVVQIFLRNMFDTGIFWADPMIRILVLWIGLVGAMIASRNNHHISIDVISRYLPGRAKKLSTLVVSVFTSVVCAVMAHVSLKFVLMERADKMIAFGAVPVWVCESIIPAAFAIISVRYGLSCFSMVKDGLKRGPV